MNYIQKRGMLVSILLTLASSVVSYADSSVPFEMSDRSVSVEFLGTKTTKELNELAACAHKYEMNFSLGGKTQDTFAILANPFEASSRGKSRHSQPVQRIGLNFTATAVTVAPQTDLIPLNATGSVGSKQFILMSYQNIRSFNKKTGKPDGVLNTDAASFFGNSPNDVRMEYDRFSKRWFASAEVPNAINPSADLLIVVSSDSVIKDSTSWYFYLFTNEQLIPQITPLGSGSLDYQQLAIDQHAVYVSLDAFDSLDNFVGTSTLVIQKSSLIRGFPVFTVFSGIFPEANHVLGEFTPPADNFDPNPEFGYLIHASNEGYPSGNTYTQLYLYRIVNPGSKNPGLVGPFAITVPPYSEPANAPHLGNLYGDRGNLQIGLFGALMAPHVRDRQLFACQPIEVDITGTGTPNGDRVGVRWYQLDLTGDPRGTGKGEELLTTVPALVQSGTLFDSTNTGVPLYYYIPSIMTNKNQDLVIEATVSGANALTNVVYAGRLKRDPLGTLRNPALTTANTDNVYNYGPLEDFSNGNIGQRWGDESSLSPDPVKDLDIWATGEFAAVQNGWGVQVTQLKPGRPSKNSRTTTPSVLETDEAE